MLKKKITNFISKFFVRLLYAVELIEYPIGHDKIIITCKDNFYIDTQEIHITPFISKGEDKDIQIKLKIEIKPINKVTYRDNK